MIPQNFKDILLNTDYTGFFQTLSMIIFILFFVTLVLYDITRPKKFYNEAEQVSLHNENH